MYTGEMSTLGTEAVTWTDSWITELRMLCLLSLLVSLKNYIQTGNMSMTPIAQTN